MLVFLGPHDNFGYSYSFSLGAVWQIITVMQPHFFFHRILSFQNIICNHFVSNGKAMVIPHMLPSNSEASLRYT